MTIYSKLPLSSADQDQANHDLQSTLEQQVTELRIMELKANINSLERELNDVLEYNADLEAELQNLIASYVTEETINEEVGVFSM